MLAGKCGGSLKIAFAAVARLAKPGAMRANGDPPCTPALPHALLPIHCR